MTSILLQPRIDSETVPLGIADRVFRVVAAAGLHVDDGEVVPSLAEFRIGFHRLLPSLARGDRVAVAIVGAAEGEQHLRGRLEALRHSGLAALELTNPAFRYRAPRFVGRRAILLVCASASRNARS